MNEHPVNPLIPSNDASASTESVRTDSDWLADVRRQTPARLFVGRAGVGYQTRTHLELRRDHASALDAVHAELNLAQDLGSDLIATWNLFSVQTEATSKSQYLMRPDSGRRLTPESRATLQRRCPRGVDLQIVIGDGLSAAAVRAQVPLILPHLMRGAQERGLKVGQPFVVRYCRVGILNDIGDLLKPQVIVLLIGERPGLATSESLSAYFAFEPRSGHTDANRNLISNIHARGLPPELAVSRILALADRLRLAKRSGFDIKEDTSTEPPTAIAVSPL